MFGDPVLRLCVLWCTTIFCRARAKMPKYHLTPLGPLLDQTQALPLTWHQFMLQAKLWEGKGTSHSHCALWVGMNGWTSKCWSPTPLHASTHHMGAVLIIVRKITVSDTVRRLFMANLLPPVMLIVNVLSQCGYKGLQSNEATRKQTIGNAHWYICTFYPCTLCLERQNKN